MPAISPLAVAQPTQPVINQAAKDDTFSLLCHFVRQQRHDFFPTTRYCILQYAELKDFQIYIRQ